MKPFPISGFPSGQLAEDHGPQGRGGGAFLGVPQHRLRQLQHLRRAPRGKIWRVKKRLPNGLSYMETRTQTWPIPGGPIFTHTCQCLGPRLAPEQASRSAVWVGPFQFRVVYFVGHSDMGDFGGPHNHRHTHMCTAFPS